MNNIAHKTEDGKIQTIKGHSENVANLAKKFAINPYKEIAKISGLSHDIGKYSDEFGKRINGGLIKVDHSTAGAQLINENYPKNKPEPILLEYCIMGHHGGLPNGGTITDLPDVGTLQARLKKEIDDYSAYQNEIELPKNIDDSITKKIFEEHNKEKAMSKFSFLIRYIYSCLVDADFLDTEKFYLPEIDRNTTANFSNCLIKINNKLESFAKNRSEINLARNKISLQVYSKRDSKAKLFLCDMPTGSGKTLTSIKFALERVLKSKGRIKRIIYVIPYMSIIDQTAKIFEDIFGEDVEVIQHTSSYIYEGEEGQSEKEVNDTSIKIKRLCENWDAEIILTTNVQFFESIYNNKSSKLRKMHNIAESIIIFDEVHMMPTKYISPCFEAISNIVELLNSEVILMSATMPNVKAYLTINENKMCELITDKRDYSKFSTCTYENLGKIDVDDIVKKAMQSNNALLVVNNKKTARNIFYKFKEFGINNIVHLSTFMTIFDRQKLIEKIKSALNNGEQIYVISTSLIEAGVDLDFETVFRELAGIDNVLQTAGRCNREGKRKNSIAYIFDLSEGNTASSIGAKKQITDRLLNKYGNDITNLDCIRTYFNELFINTQRKGEIFDISEYRKSPKSIEFKEIAEKFKFIDESTFAILILNNDEVIRNFDKVRRGNKSGLRKLRKYEVALKSYEFIKLLENNVIFQDEETGLYILKDNAFYDNNIGIIFDDNNMSEKDIKYIL